MSTGKLSGVPFKPGVSGNPGGRPSIVKALAACKTDSARLTAELAARLLKAIRTLDPGDKSEGASWRYAMETLLAYVVGKPKERVEVSGNVAEHSLALLEALRMTPHERRQALAQDTTADVGDSVPPE